MIIPIGDSSLIGIPKNKTVGEVFEEMDADKNGRIMVKEIDPDMDAYVNSKKSKNLNLISHTFSRKNTFYWVWCYVVKKVLTNFTSRWSQFL